MSKPELSAIKSNNPVLHKVDSKSLNILPTIHSFPAFELTLQWEYKLTERIRPWQDSAYGLLQPEKGIL